MSVRQRVADLNYYLFEGIVHPELFEIRQGRSFACQGFRADVWLIDSGHVVMAGSRRGGITEVISPTLELLPWQRLLHTFALGQRHEDSFSCLGAFVYHTSYSRERLAKEVFESEYAAVLARGGPGRMLTPFEPASPATLAPFALVNVEAVRGHIAVQSVHAFPDEQTLIKVQSLIEQRQG